MTRSSALILLGILFILDPFSGLPSALRTLIAVVIGAIVLGIGIAERMEKVAQAKAAQMASEPTVAESEAAPALHGVSAI